MPRLLKSIADAFKRLLDLLFPPIPPPITPPPLPPLPSEPPHYRKKDSLLTPQERRFYRYVLLRVVDRQYQIFAMVRIFDLLTMTSDPVGPAYSRGEAWATHLDFVLCDRYTLEPVLAIELDDASHKRPDRQARDAVKDRICAEIGLPLLRVPVVADYPRDSIGAQIRTLLPQSPPPPAVPSPAALSPDPPAD